MRNIFFESHFCRKQYKNTQIKILVIHLKMVLTTRSKFIMTPKKWFFSFYVYRSIYDYIYTHTHTHTHTHSYIYIYIYIYIYKHRFIQTYTHIHLYILLLNWLGFWLEFEVKIFAKSDIWTDWFYGNIRLASKSVPEILPECSFLLHYCNPDIIGNCNSLAVSYLPSKSNTLTWHKLVVIRIK